MREEGETGLGTNKLRGLGKSLNLSGFLSHVLVGNDFQKQINMLLLSLSPVPSHLMLEYLTILLNRINVQILKFPMYSLLEFVCLKTSLQSEDFPPCFTFHNCYFFNGERKQYKSGRSKKTVDLALSLQ